MQIYKLFSQQTLLCAAIIASGFLSSNVVAQDHFIGDDQAVNRVIKLRTTNVPSPVAADLDKTSRTTGSNAKLSSSVLAPPAAPPKVKFENIRTGENVHNTAVPKALQDPNNAPPRVAERPYFRGTQAKQLTPAYPQVAPAGPQVTSEQPRSWSKVEFETEQAFGPKSQTPIKPIAVSNRVPQISTMIVAPGYINLNQSAKIKIKLENVGQTSAGQVKLIATLPDHAKFVNASPQPVRSSGQTHEFLVRGISANQIHEITIDLIPTKKAALDISTEVTIENKQRIEVSVREPQLAMQIQGPERAHTGQSVTHRILVKNTGDGVAEDIRLKLDFPPEVRLTKEQDLLIPVLQPGKSAAIELQSIALASGQLKLSASATGKSCQPQMASAGMTILQPELQISAIGPEMNFVNRDGIYSIRLSNTGEVDITDVKVMWQVPSGMQVTTISQKASVDAENGVLAWTFDKIEANTEKQIQLKTLAISEGQQVCNIVVKSKEIREKAIQLTTQVATRADLSVSIKNLSGPVRVGTEAMFLLVVENKGSSTADGVNVNIELPEALAFVPQEGVTRQEFGNAISFGEAQIAPGKKLEFEFKTVCKTEGEQVVRSVLQTQNSKRKIIAEGSVFVYQVSESRVSESLSPVIPR